MRKSYIDNLRCGIVLTVVFYHIFYELNSVGVIRNVAITGIPQLDIVEYITYPWFMVCMFALAGISARYSLEKRGARAFMKERTRKVLIPSIAGIFIYGWITGFVTSRYVDMFGGQADAIPAVVRYLIYGLSGIGPLWFCHVLFIASALIVLLAKLDKDDKLGQLGSRANLPALILLFFAAWGSAYLLIAPYISIYRFGIYLFYFLMGYEVFAQEAVQAVLKRYCYLFLAAAVVLGAVYTAQNFGQNFADPEALKLPLVNAFAGLRPLPLWAVPRSGGIRRRPSRAICARAASVSSCCTCRCW